MPVAQRAGTTRRDTEGEPAATLARWALRAVITVTALGVVLAACSNSSDPAGNVAPARHGRRHYTRWLGQISNYLPS